MLKVSVPEGESGDCKVERFTISKEAASMSLFRYGGERAPRPGTYTRLIVNGHLMMSDTDAEMRDHWEPIRRANGHILINGLGIGMGFHF